jgi:transposase
MRAKYPSDVTWEEYEQIRFSLETARKATHPRSIDSYDIFCGVLYRLREGCRWRSLPHDYPDWHTCYYHYNIWRKAEEGQESVLDLVLRELVESERIINGREPKTTMTIVDSKTIQNTDTAEEKGYDAGKKNRCEATYRS